MGADKDSSTRKNRGIYLNKTGFVVFNSYDGFSGKERRHSIWIKGRWSVRIFHTTPHGQGMEGDNLHLWYYLIGQSDKSSCPKKAEKI